MLVLHYGGVHCINVVGGWGVGLGVQVTPLVTKICSRTFPS